MNIQDCLASWTTGCTLHACRKLLLALGEEEGMHLYAFNGCKVCCNEICIHSSLTVEAQQGQQPFEPFLKQMWWPSALIDLAYAMLRMIGFL